MANKFVTYFGCQIAATLKPTSREIAFCRFGGKWKPRGSQKMVGNGLFFHFKRGCLLLWPEIKWHRWLDLFVEEWLRHRSVGVLGGASTGKTLGAAMCHLFDWYCHPECTTVLVCSTTKERLEERIWGEMKRLHKLAKSRDDTLPGYLIEKAQRLVLDKRSESVDGRDFRNGCVGVPCGAGEGFRGLGNFIGIKNARVRLAGDELQLMPKVFVEALSNLDKNEDTRKRPELGYYFRATGLGNPKETTDALGVLCEPATELGGWDGGIDRSPGTKVWKTRRPDGICIQLRGSDSPNLDGKLGIPIITQAAIDRDVALYGTDSLQYTMMNEGIMPRGQGSRRVLTRQSAIKFHAMDAPVWKGSPRTKVAGLDAAYRGTGGDRCILVIGEFGEETLSGPEMLTPVKGRIVLAITEAMLVPVSAVITDMPEEQIALFCKQKCEDAGIPPENFFFDQTGRGSLTGAFGRIWSPNVQGIEFGGKPTDRGSEIKDITAKERYFNFVTELWYSVRLVVEADQFRGLTEDALMEFCQREWFWREGTNKIQVEVKQDMKKKSGRSPDIADAVAVFVEGARRRGFIIKNIIAPQSRRIDQAWKAKLLERARTLARAHDLVQAA